MLDRRKLIACAGAAAVAPFASRAGLAQGSAAWPNRIVKLVVPFTPGGGIDAVGRIIGARLSEMWGQQVVVENKPGAGGNIGSDFVAKAKPDGYTILGGTISSHAINPSIYPKMPYDAVKSFQPITLIGTNANVLVVGAASTYKTVQDVIAAAKAKPGSISFASAGNGTSQHLSGELFKSLAGISMEHVPYKGSGPAIQDVMAGHVPLMFDTTVVAAPHIQSGKVRALAVTSTKRVGSLPGVPTMAEAGVKGYEILSWQGIFAPAGTPKEIVQRLNAEIVKILKMPDMRERLAGLGLDPVGNTPDEFAAFQQAEIAKWAKLVKEAKITAD
jgi:tripartite-type tricarboxylate transporter receptor subunit TctC